MEICGFSVLILRCFSHITGTPWKMQVHRLSEKFVFLSTDPFLLFRDILFHRTASSTPLPVALGISFLTLLLFTRLVVPIKTCTHQPCPGQPLPTPPSSTRTPFGTHQVTISFPAAIISHSTSWGWHFTLGLLRRIQVSAYLPSNSHMKRHIYIAQEANLCLESLWPLAYQDSCFPPAGRWHQSGARFRFCRQRHP